MNPSELSIETRHGAGGSATPVSLLAIGGLEASSGANAATPARAG